MSRRVAPEVAGRRVTLLLLFLLLVVAAANSLEAQPSDDAYSAHAPVKVAIIDVQRLVFESKVGKEALGKLRNLREQKQAEAKAMQQEIQELRERLTEGTLSLSEEKLDELQKELEEKIIDYRRFEDDADRELQKGQEKAFENIERQVMPIIRDVGVEFGYTAIFNKFQAGLLYARDEVDITDLILARFDQSAEQGN